jgi:hypothetical protein
VELVSSGHKRTIPGSKAYFILATSVGVQKEAVQLLRPITPTPIAAKEIPNFVLLFI